MKIFNKLGFKKYIAIFEISFQQEFIYRFNFIMWRVRNVLQIFLVFFLWDTVFSDPNRILFGYDRAKILTYVFLTIFTKAFVFSARAVDVSSEIARGDISNYLVRPVSYFKYWLTRDLSSKALNFSFALVEVLILSLVLKPDLFFQMNFLYLFLTFLSLVIAVFLFFCILFIVSAIPFWMPEASWGGNFLLIIILEFLSGSLFPIDVLPTSLQNLLYWTPFPYLIFFPIQIYLGSLSFAAIFKGLVISGIWMFTLYYLMKSIWKRGLLAYQAFGK